MLWEGDVTCRVLSCDGGQYGLTSSHASSWCSPLGSSLTLLAPPFMACRLLGGAYSSVSAMAGLFLSSILATADGRVGTAEGAVAIGMRRKKDGELEKGVSEKGEAGEQTPAKGPDQR